MDVETIETRWRKFRPLLRWFAKRYGRGLEMGEAVAIANLAFVECYRTYDPALASFETRLTFLARRYLSRAAKKKWPVELTDVSTMKPGTGLVDLLDELGSDARTVAGLILDTPTDLQVLLWDHRQPRAKVVDVLRRYLLRLEWTAKRVTESFDEIRRIL